MCNNCNSELSFSDSISQINNLLENIHENINSHHIMSLVEKFSPDQMQQTILKPIIQEIEQSYGSSRADQERRIESYKERLANYKQEVIETIRRIESYQKALDAVQKPKDEDAQKILNELIKLKNHEKISEVTYHENKITILTKHLHIYHGDTVYEGGKYVIRINTRTGDVRFMSTNPKLGFWSEKDPHPHVSGRSYSACLGNIESSVAELCASREYLVLGYLLLDFLESVNPSDAAGNYIKYRNQINPNTLEVIQYGVNPETGHDDDEEELDCGCFVNVNHDAVYYCDQCGNSVCSDCEYTVGPDNDIPVCEGCREQHYSYHEDSDRFIHDDDFGQYEQEWDDDHAEDRNDDDSHLAVTAREVL